MARRVFFSFHYTRDIWRVNVVRNSATMESISAAGFHDDRLWEETTQKGDSAIKKMIDKGLEGTTVTIVLIGAHTANQAYVSYEIEQSISRGNGILGIRIHNIKDRYGNTDSPGTIPAALAKTEAPVYDWNYGKLGEWIELAHKTARSPEQTI